MSNYDTFGEAKPKKDLEERINSKKILLESINQRINFLLNRLEDEQ